MFYPNLYEIELFKEEQRKDYLKEAEHDRILLALHPPPSGVMQLACHALAILGHGLFSLGHRLEQLDHPNARLTHQDNTAHV